MRTIPPVSLKGAKVYFTGADHAAQRRAHLSRRTLDEIVKLLCILNDHVVIATSHIFESPLTYQVVLKNRLLLESGIILPALRDSCRDFHDFVEQKRMEPAEGKSYGKQGQEIAHFLQATADAAVSWRLQATREDFKASLLRDLSTPASLISTGLGLSDEQHATLLRRLDALENISRGAIIQATRDYQGTVQSQLTHYVDLNYYLAGASAVESDPVVGTLQDVWFTRDKVERAPSAYEQLDSDIDLFTEFLMAMDMSADVLSDLTDKDIVKLRRDSVVREFRQSYGTIVENVRRSLPEPASSSYDAKQLAQEAKQIMGSYVRDKLRRELASEQSARNTARAIRISGFVTALVSLLSLPLLPPPLQAVGAATGAVGTALQLADPLLQRILVEPKRGELILFATRLHEFTSSLSERKPWFPLHRPSLML